MKLLDRLERKLRHLAVPNVTVALIVGQVFVYLASRVDETSLQNLIFVPQLVLGGEVWRLLTFLFVPPMTNPVFAFFFWYLFYLFGTTLEQQWGTFRYNIYLLIGYVATTAVAFLAPGMTASNGFLYGTVFLAFAFLYPDFVIHLFFILPVKIRWLALIQWAFYAFQFATGTMMTRLVVAAAVCNFFLFFGSELRSRLRGARRRIAYQTKQQAQKRRPRHRCLVCGITNLDDPRMSFRYCSQCAGQCGYCAEHLHNHEHVTSEERDDLVGSGS